MANASGVLEASAWWCDRPTRPVHSCGGSTGTRIRRRNSNFSNGFANSKRRAMSGCHTRGQSLASPVKPETGCSKRHTGRYPAMPTCRTAAARHEDQSRQSEGPQRDHCPPRVEAMIGHAAITVTAGGSRVRGDRPRVRANEDRNASAPRGPTRRPASAPQQVEILRRIPR